MEQATFTPLSRGRYRCNIEGCNTCVKKARTHGHKNWHFNKDRQPPPPTAERLYQRALREDISRGKETIAFDESHLGTARSQRRAPTRSLFGGFTVPPNRNVVNSRNEIETTYSESHGRAWCPMCWEMHRERPAERITRKLCVCGVTFKLMIID